jgi:hypothetical protein
MSKTNPEIIAARIHSEAVKLACAIAAMQADNATRVFEGRPPMHGFYSFDHERIGHDLLVKDILAELETPPSEATLSTRTLHLAKYALECSLSALRQDDISTPDTDPICTAVAEINLALAKARAALEAK